MGHVFLSVLCFVLWAFALNLMFLGGVLAHKRVSGSASLFTVGMACLVSLMFLGVHAHINIAQSFRYAGATLPLATLFLVKRTSIKSDKTPTEAKRRVI